MQKLVHLQAGKEMGQLTPCPSLTREGVRGSETGVQPVIPDHNEIVKQVPGI
jgi:hypothetical protein